MIDTSNPKVLLVDDEARFVDGLARLLPRFGFQQVLKAHDGAQALKQLKNEPAISVVVLDVNMPGVDGIVVLETIKKYYPDIEVIILTGHAAFDMGAEALRLGAFDYLIKPCDVEDLVQTIRNALQAERIRLGPVLWSGNRVRQVVKPLFQTLKSEQTLGEALNLYCSAEPHMVKERLYITDRDGYLLGFITREDLVYEAVKAGKGFDPIDWENLCRHPEWLPSITLGKILNPEIVWADPEEALTMVGRTMITHNLRSMPVTEMGRLIGVVRLPDIWDYLQSNFE